MLKSLCKRAAYGARPTRERKRFLAWLKLLKGEHTYETLSDKAGARCMVRYWSDLEPVVAIVQVLFQCADPDRKINELAENKLGYISTHIDVRLLDNDQHVKEYPPGEYTAELQIRTHAQHLWAEMSHDTFYKDKDTLRQIPGGLQLERPINLMARLIEVADREFDRLNKEAAVNPSVSVYKALEKHYYKLTSRRPDKELSLSVIDLLLPLYEQQNEIQVANRIDAFVRDNERVLNTVYEGAEDWNASAFLYQPEALMILERLHHDPVAVRSEWNKQFPEKELERVANAFGVSLD